LEVSETIAPVSVRRDAAAAACGRPGSLLADPERAERLRAAHMSRRVGQAEDIAWAALHLASD
jgi:hypothetical protein